MIEEVPRGKDVAPGDFAAVSNDHADHALALQAGSRAGEAALDFGDEIIDRDAHRTGLINLFIGFGVGIAGNRGLQTALGDSRGRRGGRCSKGGTTANRGPHFGLGLIHCGLFSYARMHNGIGRSELRAAGPTAMLDAENIQWKRWCAHWNDAVLANYAVLLAATDQFASKQQKRALAAVDQYQLIDGGSR